MINREGENGREDGMIRYEKYITTFSSPKGERKLGKSGESWEGSEGKEECGLTVAAEWRVLNQSSVSLRVSPWMYNALGENSHGSLAEIITHYWDSFISLQCPPKVNVVCGPLTDTPQLLSTSITTDFAFK